ncbi:molybdenum storage protein [Actinomycetospora succinea]|uniref:Molybdenum storage protein n=1 Tax=Actinomycetospora succinea TaxID=663603 RepID=A0A4R6VMT9_9PSEU|nr:molybdenum storage protein subunit alpha [Actinomycetospora succinea]TDQ65119.1 molybdenum storage protein [Actinomycetospora succinea]
MTPDDRQGRDVESAFVRQTLLDPELVRSAEPDDVAPIRLLPWLEVVVLGGSTIVDRGRDVLLPLVEEIRSLLPEHRMLLLTGAGIRARHVLGVGLDLGLPAGALAGLAATEAEQNGRLVASLLAAEGVSYLPHQTVAGQLPVHLAAANAAVSNGYPPYGVHEFPATAGRLPVHRTDTGALLLADAFGASRLVYVRDAAALAGLPDEVSAKELLSRGGDLPIDRLTLERLGLARHVTSLTLVDGTTRGALTGALAGQGGVTVTAV